MFDVIMAPLYWVVSGIIVLFHRIFSPLFGADSGVTWTLSIIALTVVVRTAMIPLFVKQINASRDMQLLAPKMRELQQKHGADRQKLAEETQKLYREAGTNPFASCLPLLIQMPIFLSLFQVLQGVASGNPKGYWFVNNPALAESMQHASVFGVGLSDTVMPFFPIGRTQIVGAVLVLLMVVTLFITQLQVMRKNMPPEALTGPMAQQQKLMLYIFPIFYAFTTVFLPIGVLVYWLASNIWTMVQQGLLIRNNPAPNTPAYVDWEDRMRAKGKDPDVIMAERRAKRRREKSPAAVAAAKADGKAYRKVGGATVAEADAGEEATDSSQPKVQRQGVARQTVKRQQPRNQSRAARKRK